MSPFLTMLAVHLTIQFKNMSTLKLHQLALSFTLLGVSFTSQAQLMFSQYIDGSANQKGLEIYNPDATTANLADYEVHQYSNGDTKATARFQLQGSLASQQKYIIGRSELKSTLKDKVNQVAGVSFNGDDALVLYYKGTAVDRFGRIGERPASGGWGNPSSKGNSFKRNVSSNPVSSIDPLAVFDLNAHWTAWSNRNDFSQYLGSGNGGPLPETEKVSCSSKDVSIAGLQTAAQGQRYTVRGVMTADYRYAEGFSGFYLQTPDQKAKADLSNAIFVYIPNSSPFKGGKVGEEVILNGRLSLYENQLQLDLLGQDPVVCNSSAGSLVKPIDLNLPFNSLAADQGHVPKRYQGMFVKLPQTLTVSENYNYARFGELSISLNRQYIPTNLYPAKSAEATNLAKQNLLSKIILDDGYSKQNKTPWLPVNFNAANTLRTGYQLKNIEGILEYRYGAWRIQPIAGKTPELITNTNPRPEIAAKNSQQLRVSAFNVLNYDNGRGGFPTERGAKSKAEFDKQHAKIISAMKNIDADVYALMEIANNGYDDQSAVAHLARGLGPDWRYVKPNNTERLGTDVIAVAIIYNAKRVKPVGTTAIFDDKSEKNRVTMAQSFQPINGGKTFTVMPNHLKSKGCKGAEGVDQDQRDGQSCWNPTRLKAVQEQIQWIAKNPTQVDQANFLMLGDMNSYAKEEPMLALEKANYKVLLNDQKIGQGPMAYSYVFGVSSDTDGFGGAGNLDHAVADANLYPFVKKAFTWAINADEPTALGYEHTYKTPEQIEAFYQNDAYRSSDHDPVIVDLDFNTSNTTAEEGKSGGGSTNLWSILGLVSLASYMAWRRRVVQLKQSR